MKKIFLGLILLCFLLESCCFGAKEIVIDGLGYVCHLCLDKDIDGPEFASKSEVIEHACDEHLGLVCTKDVTTKMRGKKKGRYFCKRCNRNFGSRGGSSGNLCIHIQAEHFGVVHKCKKCGNMHRQKGHFKTHVKNGTCQKRQKEIAMGIRYVCGICYNDPDVQIQEYKNRQRLDIHTCAKHLKIKYKRIRHMHFCKTLYKCAWCERTYKNMKSLKKHLKKCKKNEDEQQRDEKQEESAAVFLKPEVFFTEENECEQEIESNGQLYEFLRPVNLEETPEESGEIKTHESSDLNFEAIFYPNDEELYRDPIPPISPIHLMSYGVKEQEDAGKYFCCGHSANKEDVIESESLSHDGYAHCEQLIECCFDLWICLFVGCSFCCNEKDEMIEHVEGQHLFVCKKCKECLELFPLQCFSDIDCHMFQQLNF